MWFSQRMDAMTLKHNDLQEWGRIRDEYAKHLGDSLLAPMATKILNDGLDRNRYMATVDLLEKTLKRPEPRLLDIAASPFLLDVYIAEHLEPGLLVTTDLAPENLDLDWSAIGQDISVMKWDLEAEEVPHDLREAAPFDAVLFLEIFEHLRLNPISVMRQILSLVSPDGFLIISVPNIYYWKKFAQVLAGRGISDPFATYDLLRTHGFVGHVRMPCVVEMRRFFVKLGHRVEGVFGLTGNRFRPVHTPYALLASHIALVIRPGKP